MRTIIFFIYLYGYMLLHPFVLRRGLKALKNGDFKTVDEITAVHVTHWCTSLIRLSGTEVTVTGLENLPKDRPCVIAANHRSMYDVLVMLTAFNKPIALVSKIEVKKLPLIRDWMELLHCLFLDRDDARQGMRVIADAAELVKQGYTVGIFPEGTRYKGEEGGIGEFLAGAFRIASKSEAPVVPVAITGTRGCLESDGHFTIKPSRVKISIMPPIETAGITRPELKALPKKVEDIVHDELQKML